MHVHVPTLTKISAKDTHQYARIYKVFCYIAEHWKQQPSISKLASIAGYSESHLQALFHEYMGITPKKFLRHVTISHIKNTLQQNPKQPLLDITYEHGLSSPSRLHDLFLSIEAMSPADYKKQGHNIVIHYAWFDSFFGDVLIAATNKGLCALAFADNIHGDKAKTIAYEDMVCKWPASSFIYDEAFVTPYMERIFYGKGEQHIHILLKASDFQYHVWQALLQVSPHHVVTYGTIAQKCGYHKNASRAVGTAIGANPIAWLIPCHRVLRDSGLLGGYHWGTHRKIAMLGHEILTQIE